MTPGRMTSRLNLASPLNIGLTQASECTVSPDPNQVAPGGRLEISNLTPGDHRFQCCIHPWMRALIKVG